MSAGVTVRVRITGRVQGVWFRGWTVDQATGLGLAGWVRNRRDGTVEALFAGPDEAVEEMVRRCWQGPSMARVDHVERLPGVAGNDTAERTGFYQRDTI